MVIISLGPRDMVPTVFINFSSCGVTVELLIDAYLKINLIEFLDVSNSGFGRLTFRIHTSVRDKRLPKSW